MLRPFHIARMLGVDINIDVSFIPVIVLAWIHWGYRGSIVSFAWGCVLIAVIFLSVLAQELGHAMMARENGVQVLDVSISPLAGVAKIEQASNSPRAELLIALAGPAFNLAIFITLLPIVMLLSVISGAEAVFDVGSGFRDLGLTNIIAAAALFNLGLAVFNLVPAFPLDGGRVVRAYLSTRMNRHSATVIASRIGIGIAIVLIAIGAVQRDLILPCLGLFILWAGISESRIGRIEDQMQRLLVGSYALWDGGGISPEVPLGFALLGGPHDMVVTQRGRVVGMLWQERLLNHLEGGIPGRIVADIMEDPKYVADVSENLWDVQRHMNELGTRAIPVTHKGLYRGVFSAARFLNLYRQISPGLHDREWSVDEEWREAVLATFQRKKRRS